jgi:hypothetical protein
MRLSDLPFVHYLVRSDQRRESMLISPMETEGTANSGAFFVPVKEDGTLFPHYRFHFAIYFGNGEFLAERGSKRLFTGVAVTTKIMRRDSLILLFGFPGSEPWWHYQGPHFPALFEENGEFYTPTLERVPRRRMATYGGRFRHPDFKSSFIEVRPTLPKEFDAILLKFGVSVVGCDSKSKYEIRTEGR